MADMYDALVGGAPTDQQSQQALAQALRKQALMGQLAQATGDRVLSPLGENLQHSAMVGGQDIATEREKQASAQQALTFHQDQQAQEAAQLAWAKQHGTAELAQKAQEAELNRANMRDLLATKDADKAALAQKKPIPEGERTSIAASQDAARGVDETLEAIKALDARGIETGGVGRGTKDWIAQNAPMMSTEQMREVQNLNASYQRIFTLPELKATLGTRHNQYMQQLFEQAHISPNMTNAQKIQNLQQISKQVHDRINERVRNLTPNYDTSMYDPVDVSAPPPGTLPGSMSGAAPGAAPSPGGKPKGADIYRALAAKAAVPQQPPPGAGLGGLPQAVGQPVGINTNGMRLPIIQGLQQGNLLSGFQ